MQTQSYGIKTNRFVVHIVHECLSGIVAHFSLCAFDKIRHPLLDGSFHPRWPFTTQFQHFCQIAEVFSQLHRLANNFKVSFQACRVLLTKPSNTLKSCNDFKNIQNFEYSYSLEWQLRQMAAIAHQSMYFLHQLPLPGQHS
jgi:hypothetical protein